MANTTVIEDTTEESHAFRTLLKILVVVGIVAAISKFFSDRRKDFYGLTEAEARAKFESKLGPIIGEDRAADVADQVIPRLKETGVLIEEAVDGAKKTASEVGDTANKVAGDAKKTASNLVDEAGDAAKKAGDSVKDAAEKIGKKID